MSEAAWLLGGLVVIVVAVDLWFAFVDRVIDPPVRRRLRRWAGLDENEGGAP